MPRHSYNTMSSSRRMHMAERAGGLEEDNDMIEIEIREEHNIGVNETEDHFKAESTVKEHNRRLMRMIE